MNKLQTEFAKTHNLTAGQFFGKEPISDSLTLGMVKSIPAGFNPTVGGYLHLSGLTSIPAGFNPTVGGYLYLDGLKSIPAGFNPKAGGSLYLDGLKSVPEGFNPTVGDGLYLGELKSIPKGFNPTVGGNLYLSELDSIPEGFNPTVGGYLNLNGLKSIPKGFNPTVGGSLYLDGLKSIPKGFNPTVGGGLYLDGLTSTPEGFNPTVGGSLNLNGLKSIPKGFNPTVGGYLDLGGLTDVECKRPIYPLEWQDGKYIFADGVLTEVVNRKGSVYRVKYIGKPEVLYLVTNGKLWSHGKTLAEAKADLLYKISNRNPDQFKNLKLTSKLTFAEAVACYRVLTGACSAGVKHFVEQNDLAGMKTITVKEIIKKTKGQYGGEAFSEFFKKLPNQRKVLS